MSQLHLIDWRAGLRRQSSNNRPTVSRLERRAKRWAIRIWLVLVHLLAVVGGFCLLALFVKSCGVL
ncbi:hypothetical protein EJD96_00200 (plasmid) [Herbaspirillum seropedicae]|uniref:hypothetical protein n=1 Tax=Herbaspirillum seropedicae TaxID=964 RepID=UPI00112354EF|nr:hypothetical protein [Herbaspirillum seropedicae]QDD62671.1 hypothetical protein EJD96_00200 [Herbaspirillum seropedicae]